MAIDLMRKFADITLAATGEIAAMIALAAISANRRDPKVRRMPSSRTRGFNLGLSCGHFWGEPPNIEPAYGFPSAMRTLGRIMVGIAGNGRPLG